MSDYISRADAIEAVRAESRKVYTSEYANAERIIYEADAVEALAMLPSADAVHGEWIEYTDCEGKTRTITCSECGWEEHSWIDTNYCPNCGARMKGGAE